MWTTLREAAGKEGICEKTARKWAREGRWTTRRVPWKGATRIEVDLPEDKVEPPPAAPTGDLLELLKAQLEEKDRQIDQLHQLLAVRSLPASTARPWWMFWR